MKRQVLSCVIGASLLAILASSTGCVAPRATAPPLAGSTVATTTTITPVVPAPLTFAVIGDYGVDDWHERAVARLVASWRPTFVIATGDDYYARAGGTGTRRYDESTGAYYGDWLKDISTTGFRLPRGRAAVNAFFPALGNHDYDDAKPSPATYLSYFRLPGSGFINTSGNERYYDFVQGPIHFFVLNSNKVEPHGTSATSRQARWLKARLSASTSAWNIVYDHHAPYSSDSKHGSHTYMRWPFAAWGADVVISGHAHVYERVVRGGITYFINGLGGASRYSFRSSPTTGSRVRYRANWGAQKVTATETTMTFEFRSVGGRMVDRYSVVATH